MTTTFRKIESLLPDALAVDRHAVRREILRFKRSPDTSGDAARQRLGQLEAQLLASIEKKAWRSANRPEPAYNDLLPITARKKEIVAAIAEHPVVIVSGETGSGKTTQIPKFCLAAGRGVDGKIGCTQPRRIAATTVSRRIAEELNVQHGSSVGYKIRFQDKIDPDGFIKIMTDGILLAETHKDPYLTEYDTIIVDEAHERSLNIDFILGFLKILVQKRSDLKIVVTSATIDTGKFSEFFDNAPIVEVSGRMFPVEVRYLPDHVKTDGQEEPDYIAAAVGAVDRLRQESPFGDILIFMPTEQDIRDVCEDIEGRRYKNVLVLPLFARLSASEQARVFARTPARKIIVATNIAETSITIPGIRYVIDTGLARISRYTPRTRTTSLPVTAISQSSADQRKGRSGRVENGVCIRLYSEENYAVRPVFTSPEILRANLAEVILKMIALNFGDISNFPFIDPPDPKSIRDGFDLLEELGAITRKPSRKKAGGKHRFRLTKSGELMARIPVDPRLSRMLIEARNLGCLREVSVIAAALSVQDPRERPAEKAELANQAHKAFQDPFSDFVTLLNIWDHYHRNWDRTRTTSQNFKQAKKFCTANFFSFKRMREWVDIHTQLVQILKDSRFRDRRTPAYAPSGPPGGTGEYSAAYTAVHRSILSGFLSNIAVKKENNFFQATKGREVMIFPGSTLFNRSKNWIVSAEMVETTRLFARTNAGIDSAWLEDLAKDLCKYTYFEPHWERKRGEVTAFEQVSLFGLIIIARRRVSYGRINPDEASDIFIRSALVEGDLRQRFAFMEHNRNLIENVKDMENRIRKRDLLVGEDEMFRFYQKRLKGCCDIRTLQRKIKQKGGDFFLRMNSGDLLNYLPDHDLFDLFPDRVDLGPRRFECTYSFDPGKNDDGVTVKIPAAVAPLVSAEAMGWVVPGLFREKITALIKGLPKHIRKRLVPVARTVDVIVAEMPKTEKSMLTALAEFIHRRFGIDIPAAAWSEELLPDHLKMRIAITGPGGQEVHAGRDPSILCRHTDVGDDSPEPGEIRAARKKWEKTALDRWDFGDLPETVTVKGKAAAEWLLYPGLEKEDAAQGEPVVNLRLFRDQDAALASHRQGVAALFAIHFSKDLKFLKKALTLPKKTQHLADYFGGYRRFEKMLYDTVVQALFSKNIRSGEAFVVHAQRAGPAMIPSGRLLLEKSTAVLEAYHETRTVLYDLETAHRRNATMLAFLGGLRGELGRLVPENFAALYDPDRLVHIVRYLRAVGVRARRAVVDFEKDQAKAREVRAFTDSLDALLQGLPARVSQAKRSAVEEFFWLIEEYKVSVFAQELKTAVPVSKKRLDQTLSRIERMV